MSSNQLSSMEEKQKMDTEKKSFRSQQKTKNFTKSTSGKKETRNEKRKRWAKQSKPVAKPITVRGPEKAYTSTCCSAPATKPKAGLKEMSKDPETGKMVKSPKGLGKWKCTVCKKTCKVTVGKKEEKDQITSG